MGQRGKEYRVKTETSVMLIFVSWDCSPANGFCSNCVFVFAALCVWSFSPGVIKPYTVEKVNDFPVHEI